MAPLLGCNDFVHDALGALEGAFQKTVPARGPRAGEVHGAHRSCRLGEVARTELGPQVLVRHPHERGGLPVMRPAVEEARLRLWERIGERTLPRGSPNRPAWVQAAPGVPGP